jgi:hypothetical protein
MRFSALVLLVGLSSCSNRVAELSLFLDGTTCNIQVPKDGSISFSYEIDNVMGKCATCIAVSQAITTVDQLTMVVRQGAASCPDLKPGSLVRVALTARALSCANEADPTSLFSSRSATVTLPDGTNDVSLLVTMTCVPFGTTTCMPITTCPANACGTISDGCTGTLSCNSQCQTGKCHGNICR